MVQEGAAPGRDGCTNVFSGGVTYPKGLPEAYGEIHLWIGGIRDGDTLVSVTQEISGEGTDSREIIEFFPAPPPDNEFVERSIRDPLTRGGNCSDVGPDEDAISEQDLISICTDTITDPNVVEANQFDHRRHKPLGIRLTTRALVLALHAKH